MALPPSDGPQDNGRGKIAAVGVIVLLMAGGLWLVHRLGDTAALQDCVSSGRANCGQIDTRR